MIVSPLLLRGHTCPASCGACCGSFTLDYLPTEQSAPSATLRVIEVDGRSVPVFSDRQSDVDDRWCRHLERASGRCRIYERRPFACDFELIRLLCYDDKVVLIQKQYGRAWAMMRLDGARGAACDMLAPDRRTIAEVIRKLTRLDEWAAHFGVSTCLPQIIEWVRSGDHGVPLRIAA